MNEATHNGSSKKRTVTITRDMIFNVPTKDPRREVVRFEAGSVVTICTGGEMKNDNCDAQSAHMYRVARSTRNMFGRHRKTPKGQSAKRDVVLVRFAMDRAQVARLVPRSVLQVDFGDGSKPQTPSRYYCDSIFESDALRFPNTPPETPQRPVQRAEISRKEKTQRQKIAAKKQAEELQRRLQSGAVGRKRRKKR